ncbi:MAG: hypothetical protein GXC73_16595, partial [Chitinophagaceae bacterium]|nr:hypothetical protein [Chitinophagaceae bacterium]
MTKESQRQLKYDLGKVLSKYPELNIRYKGDDPVEVFGKFIISDNEGVEQGDFDIQVKIPVLYPLGFPELFETSEKIPRIDDRHISANGACCVEITQRILQISKKGISL